MTQIWTPLIGWYSTAIILIFDYEKKKNLLIFSFDYKQVNAKAVQIPKKKPTHTLLSFVVRWWQLNTFHAEFYTSLESERNNE